MEVTENMIGKLKVLVYASEKEMGRQAAVLVISRMIDLQQVQNQVRMIFASAPSQSEFLKAIKEDQRIDWSRVTAFHMDEYIDLPLEHEQSFGRYLKENLFDHVPIGQVHYLNGTASDSAQECQRYAALLREDPIDIVCLGIGENTHIAFNDPHVADFNDPELVKIVDLDEASRQQQVNDGCFPDLSSVPRFAMTLTVPALLCGKALYCMVPGERKADAVRATLLENITEQVPSSALRDHPDARLFLDHHSASKLKF
ncbi:MAG: glucosamine-6-phosphate deaminase [Sphingobacterium sp.]